MAGAQIFHLIFAIVCIGAGVISFFCAPALWGEGRAAFSTISGFATLYGVGFAVIETFRARTASEAAKAAASEASSRMVKLHQVKDVAKCQMLIEEELQDLEDRRIVSIARISKIQDLYTAEFSIDYEDQGSDQRINVAALQNHAIFSGSKPLSVKASNALRHTLLKMLGDLSLAATKKLSEENS